MPWQTIRSQNRCFFNQVYINNDSISRPLKYKTPREGKGNLRLVFPAITGNVNSRSPLNLPKVKCKQRDYIISFTSQMILLTKKQTI